MGKAAAAAAPLPDRAAIPLSMAVCAVALVGLFASVVWLRIREMLSACAPGRKQIVSRPTSLRVLAGLAMDGDNGGAREQ